MFIRRREQAQAVVLYAVIIPIVTLFALGIMDYMITSVRTMSVVAAADLSAHAGAQEIVLDPDGTIRATGKGRQVATSYFYAQQTEHAYLSKVHCSSINQRPGCRVTAQVQSAGFLLPKKWITVNAIGYLAYGVTRGDQ